MADREKDKVTIGRKARFRWRKRRPETAVENRVGGYIIVYSAEFRVDLG